MPTIPTPKATTAAGSVGLGGALATIVIAAWFPQADPAISVALTTLFNAAFAWAGAYLAKMEDGK